MPAHPRPAPFRVELVGHASLRIHSGGKTLLADPWYVDPIDCNATWHWPPLVHDIAALAAETDVLWISHVHPDHLDERTLAFFPRTIPVYIGRYANSGFRDRLAALGFSVHELEFQVPYTVPGTDFELCLLESDYGESAAYDSSIVVRTPDFTVFNNNDCFLADDKYRWVAGRYRIDYGFLGYSPASYFPVCFEFEPEEKAQRLRDASERRYADFLSVAQLLRPGLCVPFAMGIRFLHPSMLWQNVQFNRTQEAVRRARAAGFDAETMLPGDRIGIDGALERHGVPMTLAEEDAALLRHAEALRERSEGLWAAEPPARPGLLEQFARYMTDLWTHSMAAFPEVRDSVIAFRIDGPQGGEMHFDFSRDPHDIAVFAPAPRFDMRYAYPDRLLQRRLDGAIDWDELHFSNRVSVRQNTYAAAYYTMLRSRENSAVTQERQPA